MGKGVGILIISRLANSSLGLEKWEGMELPRGEPLAHAPARVPVTRAAPLAGPHERGTYPGTVHR